MTTNDALLAQPSLYALADDGERLRLRLLRCPACGTITFPANSYGCAGCGRETAQCETLLSDGRGTLRNFVTVHGELSPQLPPPAVVGDIEIAPGVIEEGVLTVTSEAGLVVGMAVQAVAVDDPVKPGRRVCRFRPIGGAA